MLITKIKKGVATFLNRRVINILILIALTIVIHRGWFSPGMLDYGDMWAIPREALVKLSYIPYSWLSFSPLYFYPEHASLCQYFSNMFVYPVLQLLPSLAAKIGFDAGNCLRITFFFPYLFISMFSIYYFTYTLFKKRIICFFATLYFVFNVGILSIQYGGILVSAIADALAPLILAFFIKGLQRNCLKNAILTGIFLSLSIAYYPPSAYLTAWAILLFFIDALITEVRNYTQSKNTDRIFSLFRYLILVFIVPIIINFYWILPAILTNNPPVTSLPGYDQVGWIYALSYAKLYHTVINYGLSWPPQSPTFPKVPLQYLVIPLLVLIGIVRGFNNRNVRLLTIIAIIAVFFAKGANKPFGEVYAWFFINIPGGRMFRVPGKFTCLTNLAYAPLIGIGIDYLAGILAKVGDRKILKPIFIIFIFCFIIYLVFPAMTGKLGGTFEARQIPEKYKIIKEFIQNQPADYFRTYWYPMRGRYAFFSPEYPIVSAYYIRGNMGYFLTDTCNAEVFKQTNYIAKIFGLLNIKYCFLPLENELLYRGKNFYLEVLTNQIGLRRMKIGEGIDIFENQFFAPRFFATEHGALVVGGLRALLSLSALEGVNLSRWAIFFADQLKEDSKGLLGNIEIIVFYNRDITDLTLALAGKEYRVDLTKYVIQRSDDPAIGRWVKGRLPPEQSFDGAITQNLSGIIYRHMNVGYDAPSKLNKPIPIVAKEGENYEIWIRPFKGQNRGRLSIITSKSKDMSKSSSQILQEVDLNDKSDSFQWVNLGTYYLDKGTHYFQIVHHSGPIGMVDQFVIVPKRIIDSLRQEILSILQNKDIILMREESSPSCNFYIPEDGKYRIAVYFNNQNFSGNLVINLNNNAIKKMNFNDKDNKIKNFWFETDTLELPKGLSNIFIYKEGDGEIETKKFVIYKSKMHSDIKEIFKTKEEFVPVNWQLINPTKYRVKLSIEKPAYLIFSEGFDNRWVLNFKKPVSSIPAYSLVNSFFINQPGQIDTILEFTPQRYVYKGLWVSGIGLVLISIYLLYNIINLFKKL